MTDTAAERADVTAAIVRRKARIEELTAIQASEKHPTPERAAQLETQIADEKAVVAELRRSLPE